MFVWTLLCFKALHKELPYLNIYRPLAWVLAPIVWGTNILRTAGLWGLVGGGKKENNWSVSNCCIDRFLPVASVCFFPSGRYGRVESVKILPKRGSEGGVAAFVDFVDIKSAQKAHNSVNKMGDRDLRTDYNEPGTIPSAARGLDDTVSIGSRTREVSGFRGGGGGAAYGPPASLHGREGRYERRLDG